MKTEKYVVGFMFNKDMSIVSLILKQKPEWQKGLLNGIGGKIEDGELSLNAMSREFLEETGYKFENWKHYCSMEGINNDGRKDFEVEVFYGIDNPLLCKTNEKEIVSNFSVENIISGKYKTIGNLPWLISLALDFEKGVHPPKIVNVEY